MLASVFSLFCILVMLGVVLFLRRYATRRLAKRTALALGGWAALTWTAAASGQLAVFTLPPRLLLIFVPGLALTAWLARAALRAGVERAPAAALIIALQLFRLAVELLIHQAVVEGVAPPQMTWPWPGGSGLNPDILAALSAPVVAFAVHRGVVGRRGVVAWNALGLLTLATVVTVGILSMPTPFQQLTPDNTWIAHAPWVWLPSVLVTTAVLLHLLSLGQARRAPV